MRWVLSGAESALIAMSSLVAMIANVQNVPNIPLKGSMPPPFIVTRRGGVHAQGNVEVVVSPRIAGVQWSNTVESTLWGMASGVAVVLVSSLVLRRLRRRPASPGRRRGRRCGVYSPPDVAWWCSVGPAGQGLAYICAPAAMRRMAVPDPPERNAGARTRRSGRHTEVPDPSRGRSGTPAASAECPSLRGTWRRRTPSRAEDGSGVVGVVRWSPDSRSWQNSNGNCAEHVSYRIAGSHSVAIASGMTEQ